MLQLSPDGSRRIFAWGLRNTIGFAWHPQTREFWGMDHGSDWLGNDVPPEELNRIVGGAHYGWPWVYGMGEVDKSVPWPPEREMSRDEFVEKSTKPVLMYTAHSAPLGMVFYTARQFPEEYRNSAFVTMRGSWNRKPASGYEVVSIRFENGSPTHFEKFMTGFLIEDGTACFGRPVGIAVARDGSLLVGDDTNGMIYRISHRAGIAGR
jgi:glucose/arabinose dehydrogenase